MQIYTRTGDTGETSLFGGRRVSKDDVRVDAYGAVDELNGVLGFAVARLPDELQDWRERVERIQASCLVVGANLASPRTGEVRPRHIPELHEDRVAELEAWIDELDRELEPLRAFILPGGSEAAATFHLARSVCRRAERRVVALAERADIDPVVLRYLNRLSDFLFVIARAANARLGVEDVDWHPESDT